MNERHQSFFIHFDTEYSCVTLLDSCVHLLLRFFKSCLPHFQFTFLQNSKCNRIALKSAREIGNRRVLLGRFLGVHNHRSQKNQITGF